MVGQDQQSVGFSALFDALRSCGEQVDIMASSGTSFDELESIRVLREAVEETMEPPQCYYALG